MPKKKLPTQDEMERAGRLMRAALAMMNPGFLPEEEDGEAAEEERRKGAGRLASLGRDWRPLAPMPTLLCRFSPFFPLGPKQLQVRPVLRNRVTPGNPGERITLHGPRLSTYEEDVLIPVLGLINSGIYRLKTEFEYRPVLAYQGPLHPILRLMGRAIGPWIYKRAIDSLKLMNLAGIELKLKGIRYKIDRIVSQFSIDPVSKKAAIILHPFFYEACLDGRVTRLDVVQRAGLSRPISKALYRFVMMYPGSTWRGYFMLLVPPLNLNPEIPPKTIRGYLKAAVADFQKRGILGPDSGFENKNIVRLAR